MGCCFGCSSSDKVEPRDGSSKELNDGNGRRNSEEEFEGPVKNRSCTDCFFLILFAVFLGGLAYLSVYCIKHGDISRIINGYDNCGNICGKDNAKIGNVPCHGLDYRDQKFLRLLNRTGIERSCVKECNPQSERVLLHRCIPLQTDLDNTPKKFFSKTGISDFTQEVSEDLEMCKTEILYMFLIAFGFSIAILILFRFLVGVVVWVVLIGAMIASLAGTVYLWLLWKSKKNSTDTSDDKEVKTYLTYAIVATVVMVIVWLIIIGMRKRINLVVQLFREAGKAIASMPLLLLQPFITFLVLGGCVALWLYLTLWIESAGFLTKEPGSTNYLYNSNTTIEIARWYNLFAFFWFTQFCIGCQHMVIAGAVSKWFFTRDKSIFSCPMARSVWNLVRYHLGTVALGSFIIALVQMLRAILKFIESQVKGKAGSLAKCVFKACQCCLYCFEKILQYLTRNAYIETAMYGYSFCRAGQQAFKLLASNALRVAAINSIGDFVLFLGKAVVVTCTVLVGVRLIDGHEKIHHEWVPLTLAGIFAYLVSHCFLTVYEMAIDTIFLCFCEDCERNDGFSRPYFMSKGLMEFVHNSKKVLAHNKASKGEAWSASRHK